MTPQTINVGNVHGEPTVVSHFGYVGPDGTQTDIAVVDHAGSNSRLYQIRDGKYKDVTGQLKPGQSVADTYAAALSGIQAKTDQIEVFV